jgi:hypothetical protein
MDPTSGSQDAGRDAVGEHRTSSDAEAGDIMDDELGRHTVADDVRRLDLVGYRKEWKVK